MRHSSALLVNLPCMPFIYLPHSTYSPVILLVSYLFLFTELNIQTVDSPSEYVTGITVGRNSIDLPPQLFQSPAGTCYSVTRNSRVMSQQNSFCLVATVVSYYYRNLSGILPQSLDG